MLSRPLNTIVRNELRVEGGDICFKFMESNSIKYFNKELRRNIFSLKTTSLFRV